MCPVNEEIFSVSDVTRHIKLIIESNIPQLMIVGEISNFKRATSGHLYFSLKDENSILTCVFFRYQANALTFQPQDGDNVICEGKLTVYEKGGYHQLQVVRMFPHGKGALQIQFEQLKRKLQAEGLFDPQKKKEIPKYPDRIGIITSETGAVIQDMRNILTRRFPCQLFLYPASVQGLSAPTELIDALRYFNEVFSVDVIIIGRGGGAQEDLACFNNEVLARAIFASTIPVISAIGHETDYTIADYVADLRAPTPSAAAELVTPDKIELLRNLKQQSNRFNLLLSNQMHQLKSQLLTYENKLQSHHPLAKLQQWQKRLDEASWHLLLASRFAEKQLITLELYNNRFVIAIRTKLVYISELTNILLNYQHELVVIITHNMQQRKSLIKEKDALLRELSPFNAMKRGYAIARLQKKIIRRAHELSNNDTISLQFQDGQCDCIIQSISLDQ